VLLVDSSEEDASALRSQVSESREEGQQLFDKYTRVRAEHRETQEQHEHLKAKYALLREQCTELEQRSHRYEAEAALFQSQLEEAQRENLLLSQRCETQTRLEGENARLHAQLQMMSSQLAAQQEEFISDPNLGLQHIRSAHTHAKAAEPRRNTMTAAKRGSMTSLRTPLKRSTSLASEALSLAPSLGDSVESEKVAKLQQEVDRLTVASEMHQELSHTLQSEAEELRGTISSLEKRIEELGEEGVAQEQVIAGLHDTIARKEAEKARVEEELAVVKSENNDFFYKHRVEVKSLYDEIAGLREQAIEHGDERKGLHEQVSELETKLDECETVRSEAELRCSEAERVAEEATAGEEAALMQLEFLEATHKLVTQETADLRVALQQAQSQLQQSHDNAAKWRAELLETQTRYEARAVELEQFYEHSAYRAKYNDLVAEHADNENKLQQALADTDESMRTQKQLENSLSSARAEIVSLEKNVATIEAALGDALNVAAEMPRVLEQLAEARHDISDHNNQIEAVNDKFEQEVEQFMADKAAELADLAASKNAELDQVRAELTSTATKLQQRVDALTEELAEMTAFTEEEQACQAESISSLTTQLAELKARHTQAEEELSRMGDEKSCLAALNHELTGNIRALRNDMELVRAEKEAVVVELDLIKQNKNFSSDSIKSVKVCTVLDFTHLSKFNFYSDNAPFFNLHRT
jgi:chromosome segregation ATPase